MEMEGWGWPDMGLRISICFLNQIGRVAGVEMVDEVAGLDLGFIIR